MLTSSLLTLALSQVSFSASTRSLSRKTRMRSFPVTSTLKFRAELSACHGRQVLRFPERVPRTLISEPVVITVAVAALAGAPQMVSWLTAQTIYAYRFRVRSLAFYEAYFRIGRPCPWAPHHRHHHPSYLVSMTRVNILEGNFGEKVPA